MASLSETNETKDICSAQWLLLWTTAAYAPEHPAKDEQAVRGRQAQRPTIGPGFFAQSPPTSKHGTSEAALDTFFGKFQDLCREGPYANCFKQALQDFGRPSVASRRELMLWLCMAENRCLKQAGLPTKRCRYTELMGRWRYPDGYL
uniref:Sulfhydryl oxidase n=1 Tax=Alexandrium monilatum TaxID=311494 RepID=A0A7S4Q3L1_9DINO